jgi:hypothetical protein
MGRGKGCDEKSWCCKRRRMRVINIHRLQPRYLGSRPRLDSTTDPQLHQENFPDLYHKASRDAQTNQSAIIAVHAVDDDTREMQVALTPGVAWPLPRRGALSGSSLPPERLGYMGTPPRFAPRVFKCLIRDSMRKCRCPTTWRRFGDFAFGSGWDF